MDVRKKFLYNGIPLVLNVKRAFIKDSLECEVVVGEIIEALKKPEVKERICISDIDIGRERLVKLKLSEDDLEFLFDEIIGKRMKQELFTDLKGTDKDRIRLFLSMLAENNEMRELDVTNYLTYSVVNSELCKAKLYEEIENAGIYDEVIEEFDNSIYKTQYFENVLDAKTIMPSRLFRGLLVKFRKEESIELYYAIMRIIYAGHKKLKRELGHYSKLNGDDIKVIQHDLWQNKDQTALPGACEQVALYVIADDLEIEFDWDFTLMTMYKLILNIGEEFNSVDEDERSALSDEGIDILEKVNERYGTAYSLTGLFYGIQEEKMLYLINIMQAFHINPRKFYPYALNEEDINTVISCKENWNTKDYMYCMILAVLCKYIYSLEMQLADVDLYSQRKKEEQIYNLKESILLKEKEFENVKSRMKEKREEANSVFLKYEREKEALFKQIDNQQICISNYEQELTELRNYVYTLKEKSPDNTLDFNPKNCVCWENKKILVLGGHINWQKKLKERFPRWSYVAADVNTFPTDQIRDKEFIVCNTEILSHRNYYKMLSVRSKQQHILYVHSNNIELCLKELEAQYWNQYGKITC